MNNPLLRNLSNNSLKGQVKGAMNLLQGNNLMQGLQQVKQMCNGDENVAKQMVEQKCQQMGIDVNEFINLIK